MTKFPYTCFKFWPYEWTYNELDASSDADKQWLYKNVGSYGEQWHYHVGKDANRGLYTEYLFIDKEQMVLFQLARCNIDKEQNAKSL